MKFYREVKFFNKVYGSNFLRGIYNFSLNSLCYLLHINPIKGPLYVGIDLTHRCNAQCIYCDRWKDAKKPDEEVKTEKVLEIIREFGRLGVWTLSFGGGEPLLREDLGTIIKEVKKNRMVCNVITNGLILKQKAKMLIDSGLDSISISVESHNAEKHDTIRRRKGLFNALLEGIEEVKKLRTTDVNIKIRINVGRNNYKELEDYIDFWSPKVDSIILQPIHETSANLFKIPEEMKFIQKDKDDLYTIFNKLMKKYDWMNTEYYKEFPNFFFNLSDLKRRYKCYAGYYSLNIEPNMKVYTCCALTQSLGDLYKERFVDVWKGKKYRKFRIMLRKKKNTCMCWYTGSMIINCYINNLLNLKKNKKDK